MSRPVVEPTITPDGKEDSTVLETHPSYCQITASRVSGSTVLYGSDFDHQHYVTLSIHRSQRRRNLNNDWYHSGKELIEIKMSADQWANFVSSMNYGSGTPCTLNYFNNEVIPAIPAPPDRAGQFKMEADQTLDNVKKRLKKMRRDLWRDDAWIRCFHVVETSAAECIARAEALNDPEIIPIIQQMAAEYEPLDAEELTRVLY